METSLAETTINIATLWHEDEYMHIYKLILSP
jgi:hypothetical protein